MYGCFYVWAPEGVGSAVITGGEVKGVGRVVMTGSTPRTVNPCSRNATFGNLVFASNRLPISNSAKSIIRNNVATRSRVSLGGLVSIVRTTSNSIGAILGAAYFLTGVASFTTFGRICGAIFRASYPTQSYFTMGSLPLNMLIRIRTVTRGGAAMWLGE